MQPRITQLIKENQLNLTEVSKQKHGMGSKSWWKVIDKLTGRVGSSMNLSSLFNVNDINTHFQSINTDISYVEPALLEIIPELHKVPVIHEISVFKALARLKRTATGPDDLPFWFWKGYAMELTTVITHILNVSLVSQQGPKIWKTANVRPIPKDTNISALDQLRPISVTDITPPFLFLSCILTADIIKHLPLNVRYPRLTKITILIFDCENKKNKKNTQLQR